MKRKIVLSLLCLFLVVSSIPIALADEGNPTETPPVTTPTEPETPTAPEAPPAPTIQTNNCTCKQIVLNAVEGCEYALVKQGTPVTELIQWQPNPVFTELEVGVTYTIYERIAANGEIPPSASSDGLAYTPTHQYENSIVAPTCTEKGYTKHVCKTCGDNYTDAEQSALGHDYTSDTVAPTCTERGYTKHTCTRCGDSYVDSYKNTTSHKLTKTTAKKPTCTAAGHKEYWTCTNCNKVFSDSKGKTATTVDKCQIKALGHDYKNHVVAPTCTEKGYTKHTCTRCGHSYTDSSKSALGHKYKDTVIAPTCTEKGYTKHTCTRCGHSYMDSYKKALGHRMSKTTAKKPTCTAAGHKEYWTCTRCKKVFSDSKGKNVTTVAKRQLKALGHSYHRTITKATPSQNGSIRTVCKRCGTRKSSTTIYRPSRLILSQTSYSWDGASHRPTVKVMRSNGKRLPAKLYTVSYPSNTSSTGKHTLTVTFKGKRYSGSMTASYFITSRSITNKTVQLSRQHYTYNGKAHEPTVTIAGLTRGTDYTVTYLDNVNAGFASVRITGKGNYTGTVKKTFTIRPRRTSIKKLTARKEGFYVRWKAVKNQVSGYEIEYARKGNFKKSTTIRQEESKRSYKAEGLQGGKNYYVRVRAYKLVGNTRVYSRWSAVWQIETKDATSHIFDRTGTT